MKCSVSTCGNEAVARGWCHKHYYAARKYGDPTKLVLKQHHGKTLAERIEIYTKRTEDCWLWIGYRDPQGYGRLNVGNRPLLAHRLSYEQKYGSIPDGKILCHKCDNPQCVNPDHMFVGTQADNIADMEHKGRARKVGRAGSKHSMAVLSEAQARKIKFGQEPASKMADRYGVTTTTIYEIRTGKTWKHLK